jgi:glucose-1-phosphate adenylyltransferase
MTFHDNLDSINALPKGVACVLLAGGKGTRLGDLTAREAKPALTFINGVRIVDFVMQNALYSGVDPLLVCTQWHPSTMIEHLRQNWLSRFSRGIVFRDGSEVGGADGYLGTAHAVACNAAELDAAGTQQLLVLAADHIYQMDYRELLTAHRTIGLPVTVAAVPVLLEDASRFGVFETDGPCHVRRFLEKPADPPPMFNDPKRSLASMGIYVFDWAWLREVLGKGETDVSNPPLDFGKDVLPQATKQHAVGLFCFAAEVATRPHYWRDVGTVTELEAARADFSCAETRPFALPAPSVAA